MRRPQPISAEILGVSCRNSLRADWLLPDWLELIEDRGADFENNLVDYFMTKVNSRMALPEDWFIARMVLFSKTESYLAPIDKVLPICIQSLLVRIYERILHRRLKQCK